MEKNSKLALSDVTSTTRDLCEYATGDEYRTIYVDLNLKDKGKLVEYTSIVACKKEDVKDAKEEILDYDGYDISQFSVNSRYCHIATFESNLYYKNLISFDMSDDCPIKAEINDEFGYVDAFFRRFIDFRNRLIERNQVIKDDDVYQFFLAVTDGYEKRKKETLKNKVLKRFKKK